MSAKFCFSVLLALVFLVLSACTTIGGFSPRPKPSNDGGFVLKVCVYRDENFSEEQVHTHFAQWNKKLKKYGIEAVVSGTIDILPRNNSSLPEKILRKMPKPLGRMGQQACDRIVYFIGRRAGDIVFGVFAELFGMPLYLGGTDKNTQTQMVIAGEIVSLSHMITDGPRSVFAHEGYHLLGCGHYSWKKCSQQIERLKKLVADNPDQPDFVPALTADGRVCRNRTDVDMAYFGFGLCPKVFDIN